MEMLCILIVMVLMLVYTFIKTQNCTLKKDVVFVFEF